MSDKLKQYPDILTVLINREELVERLYSEDPELIRESTKYLKDNTPPDFVYHHLNTIICKKTAYVTVYKKNLTVRGNGTFEL